MKRISPLFLALAMAVSLFTGCGKKNNAETGESDSNIRVLVHKERVKYKRSLL